MIFALFLLSFIKPITSLCYRYEQGIYNKFNILVDPNFICLNGANFIGFIQFKENFAFIPQIIINSISYKYDKHAKYSFSILTTTKKDWTFQIECVYQQLYKYEFQWMAVNDDRLMVINDYMKSDQLVTGYWTPYYYFPVQNVQLNVAIQIVSFFADGLQVQLKNIQLQIDQTGNRIAIRVTSGMVGLGIQIIAGLASCFTWYGGARTLDFLNTNQIFVNDNINIIPIHCSYYIIELYTSSYREIQFSYDRLINGSSAWNVYGYGGGAYSYYIIMYDISLIAMQPHNLKKMRVSKQLNRDYNLELSFLWQQLKVSELDLIYRDQQSSILSKVKSQNLSLIYQYKCQPGQKLVVSVLQCQDCTQFNYDIVQYCYKGFNIMTFYLDLFQQQETFCDFTFELNNQGFIIKETIITEGTNSVTNTYTMVQIEIKAQ